MASVRWGVPFLAWLGQQGAGMDATHTPLGARLARTDRQQRARELLALADIRCDGARPWDMRIHHPGTLERVLAHGSLGLGESYMDGWWDCERVDEFICRVLQARLDQEVGRPGWWWAVLRARLSNLQSVGRAWQVAQVHYD